MVDNPATPDFEKGPYMLSAQETAASAATKLGPPVGVITSKFAGIPVASWIEWATLLYLVLLIGHKVWVMGVEAVDFWKKKPQPKHRRKTAV